MSKAIIFVASIAGVLAACGTSKSSDNTPAPQAAPASPAPVSAADKAKLDAQFALLPGAAVVRVPVDANGNTVGQPDMRTVQDASGLTDGPSTAKAFDGGAEPSKLVASKDELDGDTSTQSWSGWNNYQQGSNYNSSSQTYSATQATTYTSYQPVSYTGSNSYQPTYTYGSTYTGTPTTGTGSTYGTTIPLPTYQGYGTSYGQSYTNTYGNSYQGCGSYCGGWGQSYWTSNYKPVLYWQGTGWNYGMTAPTQYNAGGYNYYCYTPYKYW